MNLVETALSYLRADLSVLPARLADKRPALSGWKSFQSTLPSEQQVRVWFENAESLCIVTGAISKFLELLDFDQRGELFQKWCERVCEMDPALLARLVIERSPSGGWHVIYRCLAAICGNMKLAQRKIFVESAEPLVIQGKRFVPRKEPDGRFSVLITLIETRGEGGLFLCAPSPGYELTQGVFRNIPVITAEQRDILLEAAWSLNEFIPEPEKIETTAIPSAQRPGDDFNQRGDVRELLVKHGWSLVRSGENEYWRRPGKDRGWSATLKNGVLYVFSSNADPFESDKAYSPFGVYARLEHGGDYRKAAVALRGHGFGANPDDTAGVDISGIISPKKDDQTAASNVLRPNDLFHFNFGDDPNALLGNRWLCRAGSCLVVGQTGIGKSSFSMQAMVTWALGEALFGITPKRPLRSLVIQAENDVGDLSEMFVGVVSGLDCADRLNDLQPMLTFVTETGKCGDSFHPWVVSLIEVHKPDLVWIDPLFAFLGGNASDQETVSKFLRNGLGAVAQQTGVTWMIVHHTNKPPKDPEQRNAAVASDYAYLGSGSAELANWARAAITLREIENSLFELRAAKRGRRAGLVDANDDPATEVYLRHGDKGICWERALAPENERVQGENDQAQDVIDAMIAGQIYSRAEMRKLAETVLGIKKSTFSMPDRRGFRILKRVLEQTRHPLQPGFFVATTAGKRNVNFSSENPISESESEA